MLCCIFVPWKKECDEEVVYVGFVFGDVGDVPDGADGFPLQGGFLQCGESVPPIRWFPDGGRGFHANGELLATEENTIKTEHKKIKIAKVRTYEYETLAPAIQKLIDLQNEDDFTIVAQMKEVVHEYKSQNSEFEVIDKQNSYLESSRWKISP